MTGLLFTVGLLTFAATHRSRTTVKARLRPHWPKSAKNPKHRAATNG